MSGRPLHAVALPTGPALLEMLAAALDGGPALLPVDPSLPAPARRRLFDAMRPTALVDVRGTHNLDDVLPVEDEVAVVIATSGSSGEPKGVQLSAEALRHSAWAALRRLDAAPGER
ncbi:MAG: hypothetical protein WCB04_10070, partial [Mycobacteriales bacterium]